MGASLPFREPEMGRIRRIDAVADLLTVAVVYRRVFRHRIAVDIDLPADAAAMGAFVCDAGEFLVISGGVEFHLRHNITASSHMYPSKVRKAFAPNS